MIIKKTFFWAVVVFSFYLERSATGDVILKSISSYRKIQLADMQDVQLKKKICILVKFEIVNMY